MCRAPCWPPYPGLVRALDAVGGPFSDGVSTRGKMSLPCSLLSASTLGLTAVVSPLRARPPMRLRCHIGHLAETLLDHPRRTRCTCRLHWACAVGVGHHPGCKSAGGGGVSGMTPWCDDLVYSWRHLLADRHLLPLPWTLSLHRRWCPSASHHSLTFLFLLALTFPLPSPFPSLGLPLRRPWCPSASPHSFPSLSLGRLCQRSPRTCPFSLLCV